MKIFLEAKEYGSIIDINACDWEILKKYIDDFQVNGQLSFETSFCEQTQQLLKRICNIALLLSQKYEVVVANPPYMGNYTSKISDYILPEYSDEKYDLYTIIYGVFRKKIRKKGYISFVTGDSWMFTDSFEAFRRKLICSGDIISLLHLGTQAFEDGFGTVAFTVSNRNCKVFNSTFYDLTQNDGSIDSVQQLLNSKNTYVLNSNSFMYMDDCRIAYRLPEPIFPLFAKAKIGDFCIAKAGVVSGNDKFFVRNWYEVNSNEIKRTFEGSYEKYYFFKNGGGNNRFFGNNYYVLRLADLYDKKY